MQIQPHKSKMIQRSPHKTSDVKNALSLALESVKLSDPSKAGVTGGQNLIQKYPVSLIFDCTLVHCWYK